MNGLHEAARHAALLLAALACCCCDGSAPNAPPRPQPSEPVEQGTLRRVRAFAAATQGELGLDSSFAPGALIEARLALGVGADDVLLDEQATHLTFSHAGDRAAVATSAAIHLLEGGSTRSVETPHATTALAWPPGGRLLRSCDEGHVHALDVATARPLEQWDSATPLAVSADGRRFATVAEGALTVRDVSSLEAVWSAPTPGAVRVALDDEGACARWSDQRGEVRTAAVDEPPEQVGEHVGARVIHLRTSDSCTRSLTVSATRGELSVRGLDTRARTIPAGPFAVEVAPTGPRLAWVDPAPSVHVLDPTLDLERRVQIGRAPVALTLSPGGEWLVVVGGDGTISRANLRRMYRDPPLTLTTVAWFEGAERAAVHRSGAILVAHRRGVSWLSPTSLRSIQAAGASLSDLFWLPGAPPHAPSSGASRGYLAWPRGWPSDGEAARARSPAIAIGGAIVASVGQPSGGDAEPYLARFNAGGAERVEWSTGRWRCLLDLSGELVGVAEGGEVRAFLGQRVPSLRLAEHPVGCSGSLVHGASESWQIVLDDGALRAEPVAAIDGAPVVARTLDGSHDIAARGSTLLVRSGGRTRRFAAEAPIGAIAIGPAGRVAAATAKGLFLLEMRAPRNATSVTLGLSPTAVQWARDGEALWVATPDDLRRIPVAVGRVLEEGCAALGPERSRPVAACRRSRSRPAARPSP